MKTMKNESNKQIPEELLRLAANRYMEEKGEEIFKEAQRLNREEGEVPEEEIKKFRKLYKREFRKKRANVPIKYKVAAAVAIVLVVANVSIVSVPAVKQVALNFLTKTEKTHTEIRISDEKLSKKTNDTHNEMIYRIQLDKEYQPTYLPKGFRVSQEQKDWISLNVVYNNADDDREITFLQLGEHAGISLDTEEAVVDYVDINGETAMFVTKKERLKIFWRVDGYFILITSSGVDKEELIKMAKSVEIVE